jgi:hypothetical protein
LVSPLVALAPVASLVSLLVAETPLSTLSAIGHGLYRKNVAVRATPFTLDSPVYLSLGLGNKYKSCHTK